MFFFEELDIFLGKEGIRVLVYGLDGKVYEMVFKMWNEKIFVLMLGWNMFVKEYKFSMYCDFFIVLMFRYKVICEICVVIDFIRYFVVR